MYCYPPVCRFILILLAVCCIPAIADPAFDKLLSEGKFREAVEYADEKFPTAQRDAATWVKVGKANEGLGVPEKALACYLVAWRMDSKNYEALLGAATIYNGLNQPDNALTIAKKALDISFTAEASWEYAKACIALDRVIEAKSALEKVIASDPGNAIANKELGNIYFKEGKYDKALALLKKTNAARPDGELIFKIGKTYVNLKKPDSAIAYLKNAINKGASPQEATLELARAYYTKEDYASAASYYNKSIAMGGMEARDYYHAAVANEKSKKTADAIANYDKAISLFGDDKSQEALLAREKVARDHIKKKNFPGALAHLEFIAAADAKASIVPDVYFLLADAYQGSRQGKRAIASLERAIALNKKNVGAYAALADLYEKNGMPDKAKKTFETMMSLSPNDPGVYLSLGQYNLKAKKYDEAFKNFERSLSLKRSAEAAEGMAIAAMSGKRFDIALDAAETAVALNPKAREAAAILSTLLMKRNAYKEAKPHLEALVKMDPGSMEYKEQLAECYAKTGEKAKLLDLDKKIVAGNSQNVASRLRLAQDADKRKDDAAALNLYRELFSLQPKNAKVLHRLYELSLKKKDLSGASMYISRYLQLRPTAEANRDYGDVLYRLKDYDGALAAYRNAIKLDPTIKGFHKRYAEIVIAKGQEDEVITALGRVVQAGEADFSTYHTLGMMYQKKKAWSKAVEMYQKALSLNPKSSEALASLASCQAAAGMLSDAVISYEQVIMMDAGAVDEIKELAKVYDKQGNAAAATKTYKKYFAKKPGDQDVAKMLGKLSYEAGKYADAAKYLAPVTYASAEDVDFGLMYASSLVKLKKNKDAIRVLSALKTLVTPRMPARATLLKMLAEAHEKEGQETVAANFYAEYTSLKGVHDPEAAFKSASLLEKSNPAAAQSIYERNIKQYPDDYRNFMRLGLLLSSNAATLNKAAMYLKRTTDLARNVPTVWLELAKMYEKLGKVNEELEAYRQFIANDPQHPEANKRMGIILAGKGQLTEAMIYLEIANTMMPGDPEVMTALAKGYTASNRFDEALNLLEKAKAKKPDDPDIRFGLFDLYQKTGKKQKAKEEMKQLVSMKRDNKVLMQYANACIVTGDLTAAETAIEDVLATEADNIEVLMLKGKVQTANKKYNEAIETYKEISYIDQDHAPSMAERAHVYLLQSKIQWAETFFQRALKADPKNARAEFGMALVCKVKKEMACYRDHLDRAKILDPFDQDILEEAKKAQR
ncbi:MAG: tetratricopeptide repeat protein [Chitinispirillaceae bacterium]|nr:tetratricopeptide repeat protein [Chitinispirillaceae bacterium]